MSPEEGPLGFGPEEGAEDERRGVQERKAVRSRAEESWPDAAPDAPRSQRATPTVVSTSQYTWYVGAAALLLIVVVSIHTFTHGRKGVGLRAKEQAPVFAAPLAASPLQGAVDLAREAGTKAGKTPACALRRPDVLTSCDAWASRPLVLTFVTTEAGSCDDQLDAVQQVSSTLKRVGFAAVSIKGKHSSLATLVRNRGWTFPVAWDADGRLASAYSIAICPQITFIRKGGVVAETVTHELSAAELRTKALALLRPPAPAA